MSIIDPELLRIGKDTRDAVKPVERKLHLRKGVVNESAYTEEEKQIVDRFNLTEEEIAAQLTSDEAIRQYLQKYRKVDYTPCKKPDAKYMRVHNCGANLVSVAELNAIYGALKKYLPKLEFNPSKSIKMATIYRKKEGWGLRTLGTTHNKQVELIILTFAGWWRLQYRGSEVKVKKEEYGVQSWRKFNTDCKAAKVDLEEIAVPAGKQAEDVKVSIPSPRIEILHPMYLDKTFENANHVDIHSAHPYYIAEEFPQLKPILYSYYDKRKDPKIGKKMKDRLVNISGFSESGILGFRYSKLAKAAKIGTNARVQSIIDELNANGRLPLLVNTDGVWYAGEPYKFKDEGEGMGQLHTDHINCTFRAKSPGAYEYLEDGKYNVSVRGRLAYEAIKPRSQWQWGDIYKTEHYIDFIWDQEADKFKVIFKKDPN